MIYQLINGMILYSDTARLDGTAWVFVARETCLLGAQQTKHGSVPAFQRADKSPTGMTTLRVAVTAVVFVHDVTDKDWLVAIHQELTGLVIARDMPPQRSN